MPSPRISGSQSQTRSHTHRGWLQAGGDRWARESKYTHGSCYAERDTEGNEVGQWQGEWSPHGRDFSGQRHQRSCPAVTVSWYLRGWAEFRGWPLRSSRRGGVQARELGGVQEGRKYLCVCGGVQKGWHDWSMVSQGLWQWKTRWVSVGTWDSICKQWEITSRP